MLSCKESTRLLSQAQDRILTLPERLQLEMHLAICKGCRNYKGQLNFLREACRRYIDRPGD
jgi:Putative zinc-finger